MTNTLDCTQKLNHFVDHNKQHDGKILLNSFRLNGRTLRGEILTTDFGLLLGIFLLVVFCHTLFGDVFCRYIGEG